MKTVTKLWWLGLVVVTFPAVALASFPEPDVLIYGTCGGNNLSTVKAVWTGLDGQAREISAQPASESLYLIRVPVANTVVLGATGASASVRLGGRVELYVGGQLRQTLDPVVRGSVVRVDLGAGSCGVVAPDAPRNLTAMARDRAIDLTWEAPLGGAAFTSYRIDRDGAFLVTLSAPDLLYLDANVAEGQRYCYTVRAVAGLVAGAPSNQACATIAGQGGDPLFHRGDATGDGKFDISDAVRILGYLFLGVAEPDCLDACDADDSGAVDISDAVRILGFLFLGGSPIAPPGPPELPCGIDPTADKNGDLGCLAYEPCPGAGGGGGGGGVAGVARPAGQIVDLPGARALAGRFSPDLRVAGDLSSETGLAGALSFAPQTLDFGNLPQHAQALRSILVRNSSQAEVVLDGIHATDPSFLPLQTRLRIPADSQALLGIGFFPAGEAGERSASLTLGDGLSLVVRGRVSPGEARGVVGDVRLLPGDWRDGVPFLMPLQFDALPVGAHVELSLDFPAGQLDVLAIDGSDERNSPQLMTWERDGVGTLVCSFRNATATTVLSLKARAKTSARTFQGEGLVLPITWTRLQVVQDGQAPVDLAGTNGEVVVMASGLDLDGDGVAMAATDLVYAARGLAGLDLLPETWRLETSPDFEALAARTTRLLQWGPVFETGLSLSPADLGALGLSLWAAEPLNLSSLERARLSFLARAWSVEQAMGEPGLGRIVLSLHCDSAASPARQVALRVESEAEVTHLSFSVNVGASGLQVRVRLLEPARGLRVLSGGDVKDPGRWHFVIHDPLGQLTLPAGTYEAAYLECTTQGSDATAFGGTPREGTNLELVSAAAAHGLRSSRVVVQGNVCPWIECARGPFPGEPPFDCDGNGVADLADVVYLTRFLFKRGLEPREEDACDVDRNGRLQEEDIREAVRLLFPSRS